MTWDVIHGDCRDALYERPRADFLFADPPFNIGQKYEGFEDHIRDYFEFSLSWIRAAYECSKGILCFHGSDDVVDEYLTIIPSFGMKRLAWINWHYRFGQCRRSNWVDSRCHCLVYTKTEDYTWNPEAVLVESDRVKYGDKRVNDTENGGKRLPGTVWGVPSDGPGWGRVTGNSKERWKGHPNQLPIRYLRRLILAYTNPGDLVVDPFCGSGTTGLVATKEGRDFMGYDISEANVISARKRIEEGYYPCFQQKVPVKS